MRLTMCTLMMGILSVPAIATAQREDKSAAKLIFLHGKQLFKARRYKEAIKAFRKAYQFRKHRVLMYNIALAYTRLGDLVAAAGHLKRYLLKATAADPPMSRELARVLRKVSVLKIRASNPRARIYVDGRYAGTGTAELAVLPGKRTVSARTRNRVVARRVIRVTAGSTHWLRLTRTHANPGTTGHKKAKATRRGRLFAALHWKHLAWSAGLTAAFLITSVTLSARTKQLHDDFARDRTNASLAKRGLAHEKAAKAFWALTAVAAAGTAAVALFTRFRKTEKETSVTVLPAIGPGGCGVSLTFRR